MTHRLRFCDTIRSPSRNRKQLHPPTHPMTPLRTLLMIAVVASLRTESRAADPTYWQDVRPILRKHCTVCHSERKLTELDVSAGLALDKPELIRKGGKSP